MNSSKMAGYSRFLVYALIDPPYPSLVAGGEGASGLVNRSISHRQVLDGEGLGGGGGDSTLKSRQDWCKELRERLFQAENPLISIKSGPVDTVVNITRMKRPQTRVKLTQRGVVKGLSEKSSRRLVLYARNVSESLPYMITLTYPGEFPCDGRRVKRDLDAFKKALKRKYPDLQGFWVLEFQHRGAPHFHLWVTEAIRDLKWLSGVWFRIVGSGDEKHLRAGTRFEPMRKRHALAAYAAKYAKKSQQKEVPSEYQSVGRFWGFFNKFRVEWITHFVGALSDPFSTFLLRRLRRYEKSKGYTPRHGYRWRLGFGAGPVAWSGGVSWGCSLSALEI